MPGYVYRIYSPRHGAFYIGQHNGGKDNYWGSGKVMMKVIKKYGTSGLIKDILYVAKDQNDLDDSEIYHIRIHRDFGFKLFNILPGGRGRGGGYKRPKWICAKISAAQKLIPRSGPPQWAREKAFAANKGSKRTPEQRARISAACMGRKPSPEALANMRAARLGKHFSPLTPEHRAKIAESNKITKALNKAKRLTEGNL